MGNVHWDIFGQQQQFGLPNTKSTGLDGVRRVNKSVGHMSNLKIVAYLKPQCGWSNGVRAILRKYGLPYEDRDIINNPAQRQEMIEKSGQMLSPCVEVDGRMLADVSGEEVEAFLLANKLVQVNEQPADAPTNQPCAHEVPATAPMQFRR
jgi:monothiol glutaredoxin